MSINKALIAAAGYGTRFLPITKTIQKEMLPILNRPTIDYVVEDCIKAGIREIIVVINEHQQQVSHFYQENPWLHRYLNKMNKAELYDQVIKLHQKAKFTFIKQRDRDPYGTAVPVMLAREHLQHEEAFLVLMGDDFIYNSDNSSEISRMIELYQRSQAAGVITCIERPEELLHKYGIAKVARENGILYLASLVEKPKPGTAPSNLANISKYLLKPDVFAIIDNQEVNPASGELYITDTVTTLAEKEPVTIHIPQGEYLDAAYVFGWLKANLTIAKDHPEYGPELKKIVAELFKS